MVRSLALQRLEINLKKKQEEGKKATVQDLYLIESSVTSAVFNQFSLVWSSVFIVLLVIICCCPSGCFIPACVCVVRARVCAKW